MTDFDYTKENLQFEDLPKGWTMKQFLFAKAYIGEAGCVACQAAKIAGFSPNSAYMQGSRMIRNDEYSHIQEYIKQNLGCIVQKFDISKEALLERLAGMLHVDISDVCEVTENGRMRLKSFDDMLPHARGAIKSISDKSGNTDEVAVVLHDPLAAAREIAKIKKLYEEIAALTADNVHFYLPDNGRDDPAHRKDVDSTQDSE
jgi:hypothetical protein